MYVIVFCLNHTVTPIRVDHVFKYYAVYVYVTIVKEEASWLYLKTLMGSYPPLVAVKQCFMYFYISALLLTIITVSFTINTLV